MKKSSFAFIAALILSQAAHAGMMPFDIVSYNAKGNNYLLALSADRTQIDLYSCPQDEWVVSAKNCTFSSSIIAVTEFRSLVDDTIRVSLERDSKAGLKPLTNTDMKEYLNASSAIASPRTAALQSEITQLTQDLNKVNTMIEHLPSSQDYQQKKKAIEEKLNTLNAEYGKIAVVVDSATKINSVVNDLSAGILKLISENAADGKINTYARDQMAGSLLDEVVKTIVARESLILEKAQIAKKKADCQKKIAALNYTKVIAEYDRKNATSFCETANDAVFDCIKGRADRNTKLLTDLAVCTNRNK